MTEILGLAFEVTAKRGAIYPLMWQAKRNKMLSTMQKSLLFRKHASRFRHLDSRLAHNSRNDEKIFD